MAAGDRELTRLSGRHRAAVRPEHRELRSGVRMADGEDVAPRREDRRSARLDALFGGKPAGTPKGPAGDARAKLDALFGRKD
jgi:hypothetical protein